MGSYPQHALLSLKKLVNWSLLPGDNTGNAHGLALLSLGTVAWPHWGEAMWSRKELLGLVITLMQGLNRQIQVHQSGAKKEK